MKRVLKRLKASERIKIPETTENLRPKLIDPYKALQAFMQDSCRLKGKK